jgi:hypothetical protein
MKTEEEQRVEAHSLARSTSGVKGTRKNDKQLIIHTDLHKPNNKLISA